jgi:hypothetical protein
MPNAALCGAHVARLIFRSKGIDSPRAHTNRRMLPKADVPSCYVLTEERMQLAQRLPQVGGIMCTPKQRGIYLPGTVSGGQE